MLLIFLCVNNKDVNRSIVLRCLVCVVISSPSTVQMLFVLNTQCIGSD